jgi:hypothetical protein
MLIIEQKMSDFYEHNFIDNILLEVTNKLQFQKQFNSKIFRNRIQEQCGGKAFLDKRNLKYPIVNPKTCQEDCNVLLNTYYQLKKAPKSPGISDMLQEASDLLQKNNCSKNIRIKFEEELEIELDTLLFYIE